MHLAKNGNTKAAKKSIRQADKAKAARKAARKFEKLLDETVSAASAGKTYEKAVKPSARKGSAADSAIERAKTKALFKTLQKAGRSDGRPLEEIVCVFGVAHAGKTTYIMDNYDLGRDADRILDIYHYQKREAYPPAIGMCDYMLPICLSHSLLEYELNELLSRKSTRTGRIIIEGTFQRKARRAPILQTIKNHVGPDVRVKCVWVSNPERESGFRAIDGSETLFDPPTIEEGFTEVEVVTPREIDFESERGQAIREAVEQHSERDMITEGDLLGYVFLNKQIDRAMAERCDHGSCGCGASANSCKESKVEGDPVSKKGKKRSKKDKRKPKKKGKEKK